MEIIHLTANRAELLPALPPTLPSDGFLWIDVTHDEVLQDRDAWRSTIETTTGVRLYDPHLQDVTNLAHPSYFDTTGSYAMLIFRKLAIDDPVSTDAEDRARRSALPALTRMATKPVAFLMMRQALVTVRPSGSRTLQSFKNRILDIRSRNEQGGISLRIPGSPPELALRMLNALVDQYLALRDPLTNQIDRWQRALLSPRSRFTNWQALLDARLELRKLDQLCEGQRDAVQELRDYLVDESDESLSERHRDLLLVRANDVMEHIMRVLTHTQRLESGIESAVQIHFSAMANRTSEVMRILTIITALFMPLTLITGIFGMNFDVMPLLSNRWGFWITVGLMCLCVVILLGLFWRNRYLEDRAGLRQR